VKARKWLERGQKANDPFNALTDVWRAFNNLFYSAQGRTEREKIKAFLASKVSREDALAVLEKHQERITYLLSQPVIDMRGNGRDTTQNILAFHAATGDPVGRVVELFMVVYQIRCNLEHGQKSPDRERDLQLCKCASPVVAYVVERMT